MIYYEQVEHDEMYFEISGCSLLLTKLEPEHIYKSGLRKPGVLTPG